MRHPDLSPLMQAVLLSSVAILTAVVLFRCVLVLRNRYAGLSYRYPETWTSDQIRLFEWLRLSIGGGLGVTWVALLIAAPRLPVSWPFGFEQALRTTTLLLLTNRWLRLLMRCNWENTLLGNYRFQISFAAVALWWIALLFAILATISWASTQHARLTLPLGMFA